MIGECIGKGGAGRVYRARHTRMSRQYAVKVLLGHMDIDGKARARFDQEAEAASRLSHPNIVSVVDYGEVDGHPYLVMDYADGRPLGRLIKYEWPFSRERVIDLVKQLADGLGHAHERGLVHRDFKPENIIVSREGAVERAQILDFGLAILPETAESRLTTDGLVLGTPAFMSPEQATGGTVDSRSDLFSLGVIMYEMLAGRLPFKGSAASVARQNVAADPPPIAERTPGVEVDPDLEKIVFRLLEKRPQDRLQSAADLIEALNDLDNTSKIAAAVGTAQHASEQKRSASRAFWLAGVGFLGLAGLVGGGILVWQAAYPRPTALLEPQRTVAVGDTKPAAVKAANVLPNPDASDTEPSIGVQDIDTSTIRDANRKRNPGATDAASLRPSATTAGPGGDNGMPKPAKRTAPSKRGPDSPTQTAVRPRKKPSRSVPTVTKRPANRSRRKPAPAGSARSSANAEQGVQQFASRYRAVGAELNVLEKQLGSAAAKKYRDRYLAIKYFDAVRDEQLRRQALSELNAVARGIRNTLRKRPRKASP